MWKKSQRRAGAETHQLTITRLPKVINNNNHKNNILIRTKNILHQILKSDALIDKSQRLYRYNRIIEEGSIVHTV